MNLNRIGEYKGYEVFVVPRRDLTADKAENGVMYIIKEDNEIVLNGEVVASVNLDTMSVNEYNRYERRRYKFYAPTTTTSSSGDKPKVYQKGPSPAAGKRREIVTVEEVCSSQVVDPTPMDEVIDKFLADARNATVETYIKIIEIDTEGMGMA